MTSFWRRKTLGQWRGRFFPPAVQLSRAEQGRAVPALVRPVQLPSPPRARWIPQLLPAAILALSWQAFALDGQIQIHDPSTIVNCDGKYYTFGTGGTTLVSEDGWTWIRGARPSRSGMAPDVIHIGGRYYLYVARNIGAQPRADINMIWSKSLNPNSPEHKWEEGGVVASSDGVEDCNAIDPGLFLDPTDGRLWLCYGSYFGYIRLVELDPSTGRRANVDVPPVDIAINCEASIIIYRDGWFYLLATHGSCCRGADSGYNIRMGRSTTVRGPYLDHTGTPMLMGGGKLFVTSSSRFIGPGHFGLIDIGDGAQKFSCHYEADLDRGGASVLDIRPLLWRDGWPVASDNFKEGTYQLESVRTGTALELAVEGIPVGGRRVRRGGGAGFGGPGVQGGREGAPGPRAADATTGPPPGLFSGQGGVIPAQDVAQVSTNWPADNVAVRLANYMCQAQQKWTFTAVREAGGYFGSPYFKITVAGTDRALAATEDGELVTLPAFTGGNEQLWRLDQLTDGTWRVLCKSVLNSKHPLALSAIGSSFATLARFDPTSDKQRWHLKAP